MGQEAFPLPPIIRRTPGGPLATQLLGILSTGRNFILPLMAMFTTASTSHQDEWKDVKHFWDWRRVAQKQSPLIRNCIKWGSPAWSRRGRGEQLANKKSGIVEEKCASDEQDLRREEAAARFTDGPTHFQPVLSGLEKPG